MSAEIGGRASKLGGDFEALWLIKHALRLLSGDARRIKWEPLGTEGDGIDLSIDFEHRREAHQAKRQNGSEGRWTIADLAREGVFKAAKNWLDLGSDRYFVFVSSDPVLHLKDLADRITRESDPETFFAEHIRLHSERQAAYQQLLKRWNLNSELASDRMTAFFRLQRMRFVIVDRGSGERHEVEYQITLQLAGDPSKCRAMLTQYFRERLGQDVYSDELLAHVQQRGYPPQQLARDPGLALAVQHRYNTFVEALRRRLIGGQVILRSEVDKLLQQFKGNTPPRLVLVHGSQGSGKSALMYSLCRGLEDEAIPVLPVALHIDVPQGTPLQFGQETLRLPGAPAPVLRSLAGTRWTVLLLDQLDSLRYTSAHSHSAWEACVQVIEQALADPRMTVVLGCRTFDLHNDPHIKVWCVDIRRRAQDFVIETCLGDFSEEIAASVTNEIGVDYRYLPDKMKRLLRHPNALALWRSITSSERTRSNFSNSTQLMGKFLADRRSEAVREHGVNEESINTILKVLVDRMTEIGRHTAPYRFVADLPTAVTALCSVGLLVRTDSQIGFAHQSYLDYLIALRVVQDAGLDDAAIVAWLKRDQSLFRREQLRHVLFMLREDDAHLYQSVVRAILSEPAIRFHLKDLVLGVLADSTSPASGEVWLVCELMENTPVWWRHLYAKVFWHNSAWFKALHQAGLISQWITSSNTSMAREALALCRSVLPLCASEVDENLSSYLRARGAWEGDVLLAFPVSAVDDSPLIADARRQLLRHGKADPRHLNLDQLAKRASHRLVALLADTIRGIVRSTLASMDSASVPLFNRETTPQSQVSKALRDYASDGWRVFSRLLRVMVRLFDRLEEKFPHSHFYRTRYDVMETLIWVLSESVAGISASNLTELTVALSESDRWMCDSVDVALMVGLARLAEPPSDVSDHILQWLCRRTSRFELKDSYDSSEEAPARMLLAIHTEKCSQAVLALVERTLLQYHSHSEIIRLRGRRKDIAAAVLQLPNDWGRSQYRLLTTLPPKRIGDETAAAIRVWQAKFGDFINVTRPRHRRGRIGSPIPASQLMRVPDKDWVSIAEGCWPEDRRDIFLRSGGPGIFTQPTHSQFSRDFANAARREPKRFVSLALRLPRTVPTSYFAGLLWELAATSPPEQQYNEWEAASSAELSAVMEHVGECSDPFYGRAICHLLEKRADENWGELAIAQLVRLVCHYDPCVVGESGTTEHSSDLSHVAANSVRGAAAAAIRMLLWFHWELADELMPAAEALLVDHHPAVRFAALGICLAVYRYDPGKAVDLLIKAGEHPNDQVLASPWVDQIITRARWTYISKLAPLVRRMVNSDVSEVAENGSTWATAMALQQDSLVVEFEKIHSGSHTHRRGVAHAVRQLFPLRVTPDITASLLIKYWEDSEPDIRRIAAGVFGENGVLDIEDFDRLAAHFATTKAFEEAGELLLDTLESYRGSLRRYQEVVFIVADRISGPLAASVSDVQQHLAHLGHIVPGLLLRLYDEAYDAGDSAALDRCLARIDKLIEARVADMIGDVDAINH